jgi:serine/threonine protein kinase
VLTLGSTVGSWLVVRRDRTSPIRSVTYRFWRNRAATFEAVRPEKLTAERVRAILDLRARRDLPGVRLPVDLLAEEGLLQFDDLGVVPFSVLRDRLGSLHHLLAIIGVAQGLASLHGSDRVHGAVGEDAMVVSAAGMPLLDGIEIASQKTTPAGTRADLPGLSSLVASWLARFPGASGDVLKCLEPVLQCAVDAPTAMRLLQDATVYLTRLGSEPMDLRAWMTSTVESFVMVRSMASGEACSLGVGDTRAVGRAVLDRPSFDRLVVVPLPGADMRVDGRTVGPHHVLSAQRFTIDGEDFQLEGGAPPKVKPPPAFVQTQPIPPRESPRTTPPSAPRAFGAWQIVRVLGSGGMGVLYEVVHDRTEQRAVAKTLLAHVQSQVGEQFLAEARAMVDVRHPTITRFIDYGEADGTPYIIMERHDGRALDKVLEKGPLPLPEAARIVHEVAGGLAMAHAAGIVHRDVKPANIMLCDDDSVKIVDFGITARIGVDQGGGLAGTPLYMPPEALEGSVPVPSLDVYSLGVTLYYAMTCRHPFVDLERVDSLQELFAVLKRSLAPRPFEVLVPDDVERLTLAMVSPDPASRPSLLEVMRVLAPHRRRGRDEGSGPSLRRAGLGAVEPMGQTADGLHRFHATRGAERLTVYVTSPTSYSAQPRIEAMRYLLAARPPLFVSIVDELALDDGNVALLRLAPCPPPLGEDSRAGRDAALAVMAVVLRALGSLESRRHEWLDFSVTSVRAELSSADAFRCCLGPPLARRRRDAPSTLSGGVEGQPEYLTPEQLAGNSMPHDFVYAAAVVAMRLLTGKTPWSHADSLVTIVSMKVMEDPRPLQELAPELPADVASWLDRIIARQATFRARSPRVIEAELLALVTDARWREAIDRHLAGVAPLPEATETPGAQASMSQEASLRSGQAVGGWMVVEPMAAGAEAELFRVEREGRAGVLKLWRRDCIDGRSPEWRRFSQTLLRVSEKDGFPRVFDVDVAHGLGGRAYAVFEHIDAPDWREVRIEAESELALAVALLRTLQVGHDTMGVIGDLSPSNIKVRGRQPILLDVLTPGSQRAATGGYGTPGYAAPEVANGQAPTARSDLFSAGVLVAERLCGRRAFPRVAAGTLVPLDPVPEVVAALVADVNARVGADVGAVLARLLAPAPEHRFQAATEAVEALERAAARVEVRRVSRARSGSSSLVGLERSLPRPIACAIRAYRVAPPGQARVALACSAAEATVRFLAAIAVADYLSGERDPSCEGKLAWTRPSFGTWLDIARTIVRAISARRPPFVKELSEFFAARSAPLDSLGEVLERRNRMAHGRGALGEGALDGESAAIEAAMREIVRGLSFLAGYSLLHVDEVRPLRSGKARAVVLELLGTASEPERRTLSLESSLPGETTMLVAPGFDERLIVDPFVTWHGCAQCGGAHAFVVSGATRRGELEYLDVASGHTLREQPTSVEDEPCTYEALIASREALALRGPMQIAPDEARRFLAEEQPLARGSMIAGFEILEEIGRGSMGIVFAARDVALDRKRALKVVRGDVLGNDPVMLRRLRREAAILAELDDHEGIVRLYQFVSDEQNGTGYLVMELAEGGDLADRLAREPRPGLDEAIDLGRQLESALAYVHARGVVHRDLKPSNVLFAAPGRVKIADFGVARDRRAHATMTTGVIGALAYAAPEQVAGGEVGPFTDRYALALLLWDLLRGQAARADAGTRAAALVAASSAIDRGEVVEELAVHASDARLRPLLRDLAACVRFDTTQRPDRIDCLA